MRTLFTLLLFGLILSGCVTASVTQLNNSDRPPIAPEDVTIYLQESDIKGEYEKMAIIDLSGASGWTDEEQIYEKARKEAAEIGANGVLFQEMEEAGTGEQIASAIFGTGSDTDAKMIAIYVFERDEADR